ncbi:MAG: SPFH domain-containing protein [Anaerolineales bacterium]|nr:SPFH domain-containing protein [Anaerolineales bacterium]
MTLQTALMNRNTTPKENLYGVQRVLRGLIWFGIFIVLGLITVIVSSLVMALSQPIGIILLVIGGFFSLIIPGMISRALYVIPEFQRVVILKLGKFVGVRGPGRFWVIPYPPFYESVAMTLDLRVQTRVISAAQTLTSDNVPVGCEAVLFWRVEDPETAALKVANYREAVFQASNSALKDTIGTMELTELLGERATISYKLKNLIDKTAATFGVDVSSVEITDIHVPDDLIQELSVIAQSRRSAQAKIAEADAEKQITQKLQEASEGLSDRAMEMYRLNVLERIGREEGLRHIYRGNMHHDRAESTECARCGATLIERSGFAVTRQHITENG